MLKMIKTQDDYEKALNEVESLIDLTPQMGTDNGDRLELLTFLFYHINCTTLEKTC